MIFLPIRILLMSFYVRYYRMKSAQSIAYESAVGSLSYFIFMNILTILKFAGVTTPSFYSDSDGYWIKQLKVGLVVFLPICAAIVLVAPKKSIVSVELDKQTEDTATSLMIIYSVVSFVLAVVAAIIGRGT